jgi:DNA-binding transcriptional regulator LsrR (DeoR family)
MNKRRKTVAERNVPALRAPPTGDGAKDRERLDLMAEVARLYYEEDHTQGKIARKLSLSTATVSRLLQEARRRHVVEVVIHYPISTEHDLEARLVEKFGLIEAHVLAKPSRSYPALVKSTGELAASVLRRHLHDGITMCVSWGQAVRATAEALQITRPMRVRVVQGQGASDSDLVEGSDVVRHLANMLGGDSCIIPSPLIVKDIEICQIIKQEPIVQEALQIAQGSDLALVGIGSLHPKVSSLLRSGMATLEDLKRLDAQGAVGDICGTHFDSWGRVLDVEMNHRTVAIDIECLREIPVVIGVSAGMPKAPAILAALRGEYINILVTDSGVARELLRAGTG